MAKMSGMRDRVAALEAAVRDLQEAIEVMVAGGAVAGPVEEVEEADPVEEVEEADPVEEAKPPARRRSRIR